jgi:hypothetical protein
MAVDGNCQSLEAPMPPIRILIADRSDALQELVRDAVADQPDLVAIENGASEVETILRAEAVDVVVVGMSGDRPPAVAERLLDEYPAIGVVAIGVAPHQGLILQRQPQFTRMSDLTPCTMRAAIRKAASQLATTR